MYDEYYEGPYRRNPMATASLVFGILSVVLCAVFYLALPCGALAVLFAILSRTQRRMPGKSKAGIVIGTCGMIATVIMTVSAMHYVLTTPEGRSYLEQYYRYYTGDFDFRLEDLDGLFGSTTGSGGSVPVSPSDGTDVQPEEGDFL